MKETLGAYITHRLSEKGMTLRELCIKSGISYVGLKKIVEDDTKAPHCRTINRVAEAFGDDPLEVANIVL